MIPCRTAARQLLLLVVIVRLPGPGAANAQDTDEPAIAVIVVWTAPFEERTDPGTVPAASHETALSNEHDHVVVVANSGFALAEARLTALKAVRADPDPMVSVDAGTEDEPQCWLDLVTVELTSYGAFTLRRTVDNGVTLTLFLGSVTTFAGGVAQSQEVVMVDGGHIRQTQGLESRHDCARGSSTVDRAPGTWPGIGGLAAGCVFPGIGALDCSMLHSLSMRKRRRTTASLACASFGCSAAAAVPTATRTSPGELQMVLEISTQPHLLPQWEWRSWQPTWEATHEPT